MGFSVKNSHELPPGSEADVATLSLKSSKSCQKVGHDASVPPHPILQSYSDSDRQALPWAQLACNIGTHRPVRKGPALLVAPYKKVPNSRPAAEAGLPGSSPPSARLPGFPLWAAISSAGPPRLTLILPGLQMAGAWNCPSM